MSLRPVGLLRPILIQFALIEEPQSEWVLAVTAAPVDPCNTLALLALVKRLGVVVSDLAAVALADRCRVDEFCALGIILVRVVIRKKDAIGAHRKNRAVERLGIEVTACGDPNVFREIVDQALLRKAAIRTEVDAVLNAPGEKR